MMIPCYSLNPEFDKIKISEEDVAQAITFVVESAQKEGQSLEDLMMEVLAEDSILDETQRRWLSKIVAQAWSLNSKFKV